MFPKKPKVAIYTVAAVILITAAADGHTNSGLIFLFALIRNGSAGDRIYTFKPAQKRKNARPFRGSPAASAN